MTDLLTLGIVVGMGLYGRRRGLTGMALLAGGLLGGYLAALLLFRPLGGFIASTFGLPGIVAYPLGGIAVLATVSALVGRFARRYRQGRDARVEEGWEPTRVEELGGMVLGGAYGLVVALVVSWAGVSLTGLYRGQELEAVRESVTGRLSTEVAQRAVAVGARAIVGDPFVASSVGRMVADPYMAIEGLSGVMGSSEMQALLRSGVMQEAARLRDPAALAGDASLVALAGDESFASAMRTFGLLEDGTGPADPARLAESIIRQAGPALRSVDALANDPEAQSVLSSPAFREAWERGDFMRLASDDEFKRLFDRVLEELRGNS